MHKIVNPQRTRLFDPFDHVLTEKTRKRLLDGWAGVFRHIILELMPVDTISGHFDPTMGRNQQRPEASYRFGSAASTWKSASLPCDLPENNRLCEKKGHSDFLCSLCFLFSASLTC